MANSLVTRGAAALSAAVITILAGVYASEGGYVNNPNDPGGATNYGVTESVARENGYRGDMRNFPKHCDGAAVTCADAIYVKSYMVAPGYMPMINLEPAVGGELVDSAVNVGSGRENLWFRQSLNELVGSRLVETTAPLGPVDVAMYRQLQISRGKVPACIAMLDALDRRQEVHYRRLAASSAKYRTFLKGWLRLRIGNIDRKTCGRGS